MTADMFPVEKKHSDRDRTIAFAAPADAIAPGDDDSPQGLRILWVKVGGLWPANTGGRLRSFHIISELSRRNRMTVVTTHLPGEDPDEVKKHLPQCERMESFEFAPPKAGSRRFLMALVRSWVSSLPVDLWKVRVPALRARVTELMESGDYDVCIADFLFAVPNVPLNHAVPVVFFAHNVEYMIWKRLCKNSVNPLRRLVLGLEWRKVRRYERQTSRRTDLTIAVSPEDRDLLLAESPDAQALAVSTGVDIDFFSPSDSETLPTELVFTGSMDWHPNEDAILFFIREILPLIRRENPQVSLTVAGRNPSLQLVKEGFKNGVRVTGTVTDIRPYIAHAAVYIVPLRIGGGTRLKIFEALAMKKAIVSTRIGAEGLPLEDGKHFVRADQPEEFARAVLSLLKNPRQRERLGSAGRDLVVRHYSWQQVAHEFENGCRKVLKVRHAR